jgi:hypothetical protein
MGRSAPPDPAVLDPAGVAFHQLVMFSPARPELADALERSPLFLTRRTGATVVAEWIQFCVESDPSPFPLARVCLWNEGVLLESFSERRMDMLRGNLRDLGGGEISADQIRVFRVPDAIANPQGLFQPVHEESGDPLTAKEVAVAYARMAWPFFPHARLGGRTPHAAMKTGRGRAALEEILETLPRTLRDEIPSFPAFAVDDLHEALLPEEAFPHETAPEGTRPEWRSRKD